MGNGTCWLLAAFAYFVLELCVAETPEFLLKYFKANSVLGPFRPPPGRFFFECSYLKTLCNPTQLSEKAQNPKELHSELRMKVSAGKGVFSPLPGDWVLPHYDNAQFMFQRKSANPHTQRPVGTLDCFL